MKAGREEYLVLAIDPDVESNEGRSCGVRWVIGTAGWSSGCPGCPGRVAGEGGGSEARYLDVEGICGMPVDSRKYPLTACHMRLSVHCISRTPRFVCLEHPSSSEVSR